MKVRFEFEDGGYSLHIFDHDDAKRNSIERFRAPGGTWADDGVIEIDDAIVTAWDAHLAQSYVFHRLFSMIENDAEDRRVAEQRVRDVQDFRERHAMGDPTAIAQGEQ